ncbi:MAG: response regulator [Cyclobacteriaceae bacterium]
MLRILFVAGLLFLINPARSSEIAVKAVLDLSECDLSQTGVALDGEWEFYWNQLLSPDEIEQPGSYTQFPSLWNDLDLAEEPLSGMGYATYRLTVVLNPEDSKKYMLHVEDMYSAFSLWVNGELLLTNGEVAQSEDDYSPQWKPDFIELSNLRDSNEVVLQIANFDHYKGGASESIIIGELAYMKDQHIRILAFDLILTGSLAIGGLFLLGLYFFGHHDKAILYFSLFCFVYSYRIIGFGYYALHHIIDIPWGIAIRLEYITLFMSGFFFAKFVEKLYPELIRSVIWNPAYFVAILFSIVTIVSPANIFTRLVAPFFIILVLYLLLTVYIYFKAFRRRLVGSEYAVLSMFVVFVIFIYNMLVYYSVLPHWEAASFWGYVIFLFSQSLILSFRFAYFLKTERDRAEIASQAKSDFLSTISHEIRTPLNAVVGISHLLLEENPRSDQEGNLTSLKFSAEHLTSLINDILDYNKLESGAVEFEEMDIDLCELGTRIHHSYQPKALEKGLPVVFECDEKIKESLVLDATRMSQILNNLLDNAIKFTQEGEVRMIFKLQEEDSASQRILFEVNDSGIGISEDKLESVFERFTQASSSTTREFGGSGLGLSIVKKLLELQGVEIAVRSTVNQGSTFSFTQTFPLGSEKKKVVLYENDVDFDLTGKKVLLVEDNKLNTLVATKFLIKWGVECEVAKNGKEAVSMTKANTYDLILMDLQMPEMDGYKASEMIRTFDTRTPIVALTASALLRVQQNVLDAGMNDFVTKPFDPKELRRKIAKNLLPPS